MPGNTDNSDEDRCGGVDGEEEDGTNGHHETIVFRGMKPVLGVGARARTEILLRTYCRLRAETKIISSNYTRCNIVYRL